MTGSASGSTFVMTGGSMLWRRVADRAGDLLADVVGGVVEVALEDEPDGDVGRAPRVIGAPCISSMPAMPLSASSIGSMTDVAISSGLAPGSRSEHVHGRGVGLREQIDAEIAERKDAEHHERHHQHRGEDRTADAEFGQHGPLSVRSADRRTRRDLEAIREPLDIARRDGIARLHTPDNLDPVARAIADLQLPRHEPVALHDEHAITRRSGTAARQ